MVLDGVVRLWLGKHLVLTLSVSYESFDRKTLVSFHETDINNGVSFTLPAGSRHRALLRKQGDCYAIVTIAEHDFAK